jgi:general secretion pathway protein K
MMPMLQVRRSETAGFILIAVLWVLAALAALAATYSVYVGNAAFATQVNDDRLRIGSSIKSGVELAAYKLLAVPSDARPPQGALTVRLKRSTINVTFVSEGARIDLNAAPKGLLSGLFVALGVSSDDAGAFANHIVAWRTKAAATGQNREAETYKEAGYAYAPRQGPFQNVLELPLVLGLPAYVVESVLPFVTVYNGGAQVDVRVAPPEVLAALPNVTPEQRQNVLAQRAKDPLDGQGLLRLLGSASAGANAKSGPATRVQVQVRLDNGRVARAEAVILVLENDDEPYRVLSWREDSDGLI